MANTTHVWAVTGIVGLSYYDGDAKIVGDPDFQIVGIVSTPEEARRMAQGHMRQRCSQADLNNPSVIDAAMLLDAAFRVAQINAGTESSIQRFLENEAVQVTRHDLGVLVSGAPAISAHKPMELQDLSTILAALRFYQECGLGDPLERSDRIHQIATADDAIISLDNAGIDDLCERLNTGAFVQALP